MLFILFFDYYDKYKLFMCNLKIESIQMEYTVSPKFALSLAKLCVGYVSTGSIPVDPSNIRSDTASSLTFDDWEEAVSLPPNSPDSTSLECDIQLCYGG